MQNNDIQEIYNEYIENNKKKKVNTNYEYFIYKSEFK